MRPRLRTIAIAFVAALLAFVFALPILKADRCADAGGRFDRATLTCDVTTPPAPAFPTG